jgi:hypothetical protein
MQATFSLLRKLGVALSVILLGATGFAQNSAQFPLADNQLWEFGLWGGEAIGKAAGEGFGATRITMAGFHAGRVIEEYPSAGGKRTLEYTIELQPLFLVTKRRQTYGGGFSPVGLKWNFAPRGRYRPYVDFNGGAMFTQKNVPPGNTSAFNFTITAGPGVMIAMSGNQALSVSLRYWHLSNAALGDSNPAFNTIELEVGYHWLKAHTASRKHVSAAATTP